MNESETNNRNVRKNSRKKLSLSTRRKSVRRRMRLLAKIMRAGKLSKIEEIQQQQSIGLPAVKLDEIPQNSQEIDPASLSPLKVSTPKTEPEWTREELDNVNPSDSICIDDFKIEEEVTEKTSIASDSHGSKDLQKDSYKMPVIKKKIQVSLDMQQFKPEDIKVSRVGKCIIVEAKEEKKDELGWISQQFTRNYTIFEQCDVNQVTATFSSGAGVLSITAPRL